MQLGLRNIEGGLRHRLIACLDRALDILDECAHAAQTRTVDDGALLSLPKTLLGGFVVRHRLSQKRECGLYRRGPACVNCGPSTAAAWLPLEISGARPFLKSAVLESGLALADEGRHALFLILGRERRVKQAPLEAHALGERRLKGAIDRLLDHHRHRA